MNQSPCRTATIALSFLLLVVLVAWAMREHSITQDRRREREQWVADRQLMLRLSEEQGQESVRLDSAVDELRRTLHHASTRATPRETRRGWSPGRLPSCVTAPGAVAAGERTSVRSTCPRRGR